MEIKNKGYTLVELVIVVGLTAILTVAITAIMMSSLLSSNRVRTQVSVRQAGDYAMAQMERMIRGAQSFPSDACATANQIKIKNFDGNNTTFNLALDGDVYRIASQSGSTEFITPNNMNIEPSTFSITCTPELVTISFTIKNKSTSTRPFDTAKVDYVSSIRPRNN